MKRHAKASSARSTSYCLPLVGAAFAVVLTVMVSAVLAAPASASQSLFDFFGSTGSGAGQFGKRFEEIKNVQYEVGAGGIAVNDSSGDVYVADRVNNRIDQFDSDENFIRAWGIDVISGGATGTGSLTAGSAEVTSVLTTSRAFKPGQEISGSGIPAGTTITAVASGAGAASAITLSQKATATNSGIALTAAEGSGNVPQNEQQKVSITATGGSFKLRLATTSPTVSAETGSLAFDVPASGGAGATDSVQNALEALANVGAGNVEVTGSAGGPYTVEFKGARFADTNVAQMEAIPSLSGIGATVKVLTTVEGAGRFEKCTLATTCQAATATGIGGGMSTPNSVTVKQSTGDVYVSDGSNLRVDQFDSSGDFIRAWGGDVVQSGPDNVSEVQAIKVVGTAGTFVLTFGGQATTASGTGTINATNEVSALNSTGSGAFLVGEEISGSGIPAGTKIIGTGPGTLLLSASATESKSGVALTANLPAGASASLVEQALNALATIGGIGGSVSVSGTSPYQVAFGGALTGVDVAQIALNVSGIAGLPEGTVLPCTGGPSSGATLSYEWLRNGSPIGAATASSYTIAAADAGSAIQCKVKAATAEGATVSTATPPSVAAPAPATAPPGPGSPAISGTVTLGSTLTCGKGAWTGSPTFAYKWLRNGSPIAGASSETYVLQAADSQTAIQCEVTGTNAGGAAVADSAFKLMHAEVPANNGTTNAPALTVTNPPAGAVAVGNTLSCSTGTWTNGSPTFAYQWLRGGVVINGATSNTYVLVEADKSAAIQCQVTATNASGSATVFSGYKQVEPVTSPAPPSRGVFAPSVTGTHNIGQTLTCTTGLWNNSPTSFAFQWLRNGSPIGGATTSTYVQVAADLDKQLQCRVTAANASGSSVLISPSSAVGITVASPPVATASVASPSAATTVVAGEGAEICNAGVDVCKAGRTNEFPNTAPGVFTANNYPFAGYLAISPGGPYAGDVFVADTRERRIQVFTPAGAFVTAFGGGRNPSDGLIEKYGFWAEITNEPPGLPPIRFAIGQDGSVYVVNLVTLQKYSPDLLSEKDFASSLCTSKAALERCTDVAVDPGTNDVYVAHGVAGQNEKLETVLKEIVLTRFDSAGSELETDLEGAEVKSINGLAMNASTGNEASGRIYLTTGTPEQRVDVLGEPAPPDVEMDPVDPGAIEPHSVTVSGTINPNGNKIHTEYRFEVVTQGSIWKPYPASNVDIGNGTAPVAVEQIISGLRANTQYHVRLKALKGGVRTTPEQVFTTVPAGPDIETGSAQWSGPPSSDPSLTFSGLIDDNNLPVHYYFEYGVDASYGNRVPIFETGTHPADQEPFAGRQTVNGLSPAGTYHYRLIARTSSGTAVGQDREVGPASPGSRFPELVSPVDKGVGKAGYFFGFSAGQDFQIADSGEKMAYPYEYGEPDASAGGDLLYLADRETDGWQSEQLTPRSAGVTATPTNEGTGSAGPGRVKWQSPELSCAVIQARGSTDPGDKLTPDTPNSNVVEFLYIRNENGNLTLITPSVDEGTRRGYQVAGGTSDCDRVVFETPYHLLPGVPAGGEMHVYEWESLGGPNGTLRSAEVLPDGSLPVAGATYGQAAIYGYLNAAGGPALSRVFFSAVSTEGGDVGKQAIFVRKNHAVTIDVSQSQTATPNDGSSRYQIASADGAHVFFLARRGLALNGSSIAGPTTTCQKEGKFALSPGCDLYDYDVDTGVLTDVTPDANAADTAGAHVIGVYGVSHDGSDLYFAALGQLVPGKGRTYAENTSGTGSSNVYLSHDGVLSFVGLIALRDADTNTSTAAFVGDFVAALNSARVTPSGQFLLFQSRVNLTPYDSAGIPELYRYSKQDASVVCVSCPSDAQPPHGVNSAMLPSMGFSQVPYPYLPRAISDDGSRVFFNSDDQLTAGAVEGTVPASPGKTPRSAYEWHDGELRLLAARAEVYGANADGSDVFVLTHEALVPQDRDLADDVYDLRFDGGFRYFPPQVCDPLTENSCQGTPPAPPASTADPASSSFSGPGNPQAANPKPLKCRKGQARRHGKCVSRHRKKNRQPKRVAKHNRGGVK